MISTLNAELQLLLRAGGLVVYMVKFTGSMTVCALAWGPIAEGVGCW
jgi:hypothetical protein